MSARSRDGRETWRRLLEWDKDSAAAERLAGQVLRLDGYRAIDPVHPLGGPDGLKDIVCERAATKWVAAAYFPRGQQSVKDMTDKLLHDVGGVAANGAAGLAFVTNQEVRLAERRALADACGSASLDLLHLERVSSILDAPQSYGVRLEFLDIEMTKEEQLAFIASRDSVLEGMSDTINTLWAHVSASAAENTRKKSGGLPWVVAQNLGLTFATSSIYGPKPHECKKCGAVFIVSDWGTASTLYGSMSVVTCPECGRTERHS